MRRLLPAQLHVDDDKAAAVERRDDLIVVDVQRRECGAADRVNVLAEAALDEEVAAYRWDQFNEIWRL